MNGEEIVPVSMNIVVQKLDDYLRVEIAGPFETASLSLPLKDVPSMVLPTTIDLRTIVWDFHYKSGSLRAIYTYDDSLEVHLVYRLRDIRDDSSTETASIHTIEESLTNDELAEEYTIVWAPDDTDLDVVEPTYSG